MQGRLYKPPAIGRTLLLHEVPPAPGASLRPSSVQHQIVLQEHWWWSAHLQEHRLHGSRCPRQKSAYVAIKFKILSIRMSSLIRAGPCEVVFTSVAGRHFVMQLVKASLQWFPFQTLVQELGSTRRYFSERLLSLAIAFGKFREELSSLLKHIETSGWLNTRMSTPACRAAQD